MCRPFLTSGQVTAYKFFVKHFLSHTYYANQVHWAISCLPVYLPPPPHPPQSLLILLDRLLYARHQSQHYILFHDSFQVIFEPFPGLFICILMNHLQTSLIASSINVYCLLLRLRILGSRVCVILVFISLISNCNFSLWSVVYPQ